jgi:hypothetical protein
VDERVLVASAVEALRADQRLVVLSLQFRCERVLSEVAVLIEQTEFGLECESVVLGERVLLLAARSDVELGQAVG